MAHMRDRLRLAPEPCIRVGVGGQALQHLDRSDPFQLGVVGAVHHAHGALADEILDYIGTQPGSRTDGHGA